MISVARSMLGLGCFILVGSVMALLYATPGSPEFVVSCLALALGVMIVAAGITIARWTLQRADQKEER